MAVSAVERFPQAALAGDCGLLRDWVGWVTMPKSSQPSLPEAPSVIWGEFTLTRDDVSELRRSLLADLPESGPWTDDEVRQMAYDTIHFLAALINLTRRIN